jgi:hypothetical protein
MVVKARGLKKKPRLEDLLQSIFWLSGNEVKAIMYPDGVVKTLLGSDSEYEDDGEEEVIETEERVSDDETVTIDYGNEEPEDGGPDLDFIE